VVAFFAGGGAAKFLKDYQAAGLKGKIPLYGSGFLTDGVLDAVGDAGEGVETTLHYADGLDTKKDKAFRLAYAKTFKLQPDVYAVQGYDAGQLLAAGLEAVKGNVADKVGVIKGMEAAKIDSPRGVWTCPRRTTRCRTCTCARWSARRTRCRAWPGRRWPIRRAAARCKGVSPNGAVPQPPRFFACHFSHPLSSP
jgi:hypothetical protein